jgi:hypothetical protein
MAEVEVPPHSPSMLTTSLAVEYRLTPISYAYMTQGDLMKAPLATTLARVIAGIGRKVVGSFPTES